MPDLASAKASTMVSPLSRLITIGVLSSVILALSMILFSPGQPLRLQKGTASHRIRPVNVDQWSVSRPRLSCALCITVRGSSLIHATIDQQSLRLRRLAIKGLDAMMMRGTDIVNMNDESRQSIQHHKDEY